jgi:hypothetical protein
LRAPLNLRNSPAGSCNTMRHAHAAAYTRATAHAQDDWRSVLQFGLPIVAVEEALKLVGRGVNARKEAQQRATMELREREAL